MFVYLIVLSKIDKTLYEDGKLKISTMNDLREDTNIQMTPIYLPEESQQQREIGKIKEKIRMVNEKVSNGSRRTLRFLKKKS